MAVKILRDVDKSAPALQAKMISRRVISVLGFVGLVQTSSHRGIFSPECEDTFNGSYLRKHKRAIYTAALQWMGLCVIDVRFAGLLWKTGTSQRKLADVIACLPRGNTMLRSN